MTPRQVGKLARFRLRERKTSSGNHGRPTAGIYICVCMAPGLNVNLTQVHILYCDTIILSHGSMGLSDLSHISRNSRIEETKQGKIMNHDIKLQPKTMRK